MRPRENACGLAETFVYSEKAQPLSLWLGSGGANKLYWNGSEVSRDGAYRLRRQSAQAFAEALEAVDGALLGIGIELLVLAQPGTEAHSLAQGIMEDQLVIDDTGKLQPETVGA